jgi:EpsI family protein
MKTRRLQLRFVFALALLLSTAIFLRARGQSEVLPARRPLSSFPTQLASWTGRDLTISKDVLDILGPGDFLLRAYRETSVSVPHIDLFVAYFPSQRAGDTVHSPKHCLPGAGWAPLESSRIRISVPGHAPFLANRYLIAKGQERQLVLYWYLAHDRVVASEYWAKFYLVTDAMRMNRSDGSLVRLTTPLTPGERQELAQERLLSFASLIVPRMNEYVPR